jgi:parallel beta-helix repeat protein
MPLLTRRGSSAAQVAAQNLRLKGPIPWIDVTHSTYGATGDGVTNDTVALQAALTAVPVGGAVVYFPPGTYMTNQLTVAVAGTVLAGPGNGQAVLKRRDTQNNDLLVVSAAKVTLRGLKIDGNYANNTGNSFAEIQLNAGADDFLAEDCLFVDWSAYILESVAGLVRPTVRRCRCIGAAAAPGGLGSSNVSNCTGFYFDTASNVRFEDNYFEAAPTALNADTPAGGAGNAFNSKGAGAKVRNNVFILHGRTNDGIVFQGASDFLCQGNTVDEAHDDGVTLALNGAVSNSNGVISGNTLLNNGVSGVYAPGNGGHTRIVISGNLVRTAFGRHAIFFAGLAKSACIGNTIEMGAVSPWGSGGTAIYLGTGVQVTTDSVVAGNVINNPYASGIHIDSGSTGNSIAHNRVRGSQTLHGIHVDAADNEVIGNSISHNANHGINITGNGDRSAIVGNYIFSNTLRGILTAAGSDDLHIQGNHVYNNTTDGIVIQGTRNTLVGNRVYLNGQIGISLAGATEALIASNLVANNGQLSNGYGIRLSTGNWCHVVGNACIDTQGTATQTNPINEAGASDNNTIEENHFRRSVGTPTIAKVGAATVLRRNRGYKSEGSGSATLLAANTSIVVTHGLATTPTRVQLTFTSDPIAAIRYWVSAKGTTTFTVKA